MKDENIAKAFAEKKAMAPMNVLWTYHLINGNEAAAKDVYDTYLKDQSRLMFQRVLQYGREKNDDKLVQNLINQLATSKLTPGALGNAYSCLLDIHVGNKNFERGLEILEIALKHVQSIDHINRTAILRLKEGLETIGKTFPHTIPEKKTDQKLDPSSHKTKSSSDDSLSSSDDEKRKNPTK